MVKFNSYVESEILPKLRPDADKEFKQLDELSPEQILTGLQYILVNELPEYESVVLELLTMYHVGDQDEEIYKSALRVAEYYDIVPRVLVRALVESMLDRPHARRDQLYKPAVLKMGKEAALIMLDMMRDDRTGDAKRGLFVLIKAASNVTPQQRSPEWIEAGDAQLAKMKQAWEQLIDPDGRIRTGPDQLVILPPIDTDDDGVPGDRDEPTEPGGEEGGDGRERPDKTKTGELVDVRQAIPPNAQMPGPSAPPKPVAQPKPMEFQLMQWSTYTAPMWVLLGGMAVSLIGMICVVVRYRRARRRRIQSWNQPSSQ